jgi:squalene monooxygenase
MASSTSITDSHYDIVIVGAGIAGPALAHGLSQLPPYQRPLRIALLERSLAEPDRIVGELLQPGGVTALKELGLEWTLEGIDAVPVHGYCVLEGGNQVHIPYPEGYEGRSFHHGKFVMKLREAAFKAKGVDVIEATVTELIEDPHDSKRIIGVHATKKVQEGQEPEKVQYLADLVVIADGCFSNFRTAVMGESGFKPVTRSHFVGAILEDVTLPIPQHGTVALVQGSGPVLLYQISEHDTRILIDVQQPLPADLPVRPETFFSLWSLTRIQGHILRNIVPQLPSSLYVAIENAIAKDRLRRMPNSFLPPIEQNGHSCKNGVILLGDAWNMRHPLTGGGMTVALNDVVILRDQLSSMPDFRDVKRVNQALKAWHWARKPLASTVNILAFALYDLFGAEGEIYSSRHFQDAEFP